MLQAVTYTVKVVISRKRCFCFFSIFVPVR